MSIVNNTSLMTAVQVKRRLESINTDKSKIKNSLLSIVEQFQCLDHIAESIGLLKKEFSFVNRVPWQTVLSNFEMSEKNKSELEKVELKDILDVISESSNQLENELIPQLQKWRNNWMLEVILIEFIFFALLALAVAGVTHLQGVWNMSSISFSVQPLLYERPVFSLVAGTLLFSSFIWMHFSIRHFVAGQIMSKLNKENSEFDFAGAFLKNTRIRHSIFKPDIIGWNWFSRKRLQMSQI